MIKITSNYEFIVNNLDLIFVLLCFAGFSSLFLLQPNLDIEFSRLLFDTATNRFLTNSIIVKAANIMPILLLAFFITFIAINGAKKFFSNKSLNPKHYFIPIHSLLTLATARVVIYHLVKPLYCRPRPYIIQEFGGTETFYPLFQINYRQIDCNDLYYSFVSGHSAAVFCLYCIIFWLDNIRSRKIAFATVTIAGLIAGLGRVAIGQHFLSDVIYSGLLSYFIARIYYSILHSILGLTGRKS